MSAGEPGPAHDFVLWAIGALTAGIAALAARVFSLGQRVAVAETEIRLIHRLETKVDRMAEAITEVKLNIARALKPSGSEGRPE